LGLSDCVFQTYPEGPTAKEPVILELQRIDFCRFLINPTINPDGSSRWVTHRD